MLADQREQPFLPLGSLAAGLGEARGDDDERANAGVERVFCGREHPLSRHTDHGEVDRLRDLCDSAVTVDARDGVALAVHGVNGS